MYWIIKINQALIFDNYTKDIFKKVLDIRQKDIMIIEISDDKKFEFFDCYRLTNNEILMSRYLFESIYMLGNLDNVKSVIVQISHCNQIEDYFLVMPSRIKCLNIEYNRANIIKSIAGRYIMFRIEGEKNNSIYINQQVADVVKNKCFRGITIEKRGDI